MNPLLIAGIAAGAIYALTRKKAGQGLPPGFPPSTVVGPTPAQPPAERPPAGPPSLSDHARARELAPVIERDIITRGRGSNKVISGVLVQGDGYNQEQVKAFQRLARLTVDGLYGPRTAGALAYFLERAAPPPIYTDGQGRKDPIRYTPPTS